MNKYNFWKKVKDYVDKKFRYAYLMEKKCDSCCPKCHQWGWQGNVIANQENEDGLIHRTCRNCDHRWTATFGPGIFITVNDGLSEEEEIVNPILISKNK